MRVDDREFTRRIKELAGRIDKAVLAAVYGGGNIIMTESKERAPLDRGDLRGSGYVTKAQLTSQGNGAVEFGHGGPAEDYAVKQHEDTSLSHDEGEAKYLRNAIVASEKDVRDFMVDTVRDGIRGRSAPAGKLHPDNPSSGKEA